MRENVKCSIHRRELITTSHNKIKCKIKQNPTQLDKANQRRKRAQEKVLESDLLFTHSEVSTTKY